MCTFSFIAPFVNIKCIVVGTSCSSHHLLALLTLLAVRINKENKETFLSVSAHVHHNIYLAAQ